MKESTNLKRSAFLYAFSILFTGIVNFIAIPVLKQKAGADEYAYLNLYMNFLLVLGYVGAGWLVQSCIRFYPSLSQQKGFKVAFLKMAFGSAAVAALAAVVLVFFFPHYRWMFVAFPATIFIVNLQMVGIAWLQASLQPKVVAMAEVLRAVIFLSFIVFIQPNGTYGVTKMAWLGWFVSYLLSLLFLLMISKKVNHPLHANSQPAPIESRSLASQFLRFGLPLSLWMAALYGIFFADRFLLLQNASASSTGHYSALFDVLLKGIGFALSPLVTAVYPMMVRLYQQDDMGALKKLNDKVVKWQIGLASIAIIGYAFSWPWIKTILKIEDVGNTLFYGGFMILVSASIWQMNILMQKRLELQKQTSFLLLLIVICFTTMLVGDWFLIPKYGFLGAAGTFLATAIIYMFVIIRKRLGKPFRPDLQKT